MKTLYKYTVIICTFGLLILSPSCLFAQEEMEMDTKNDNFFRIDTQALMTSGQGGEIAQKETENDNFFGIDAQVLMISGHGGENDGTITQTDFVSYNGTSAGVRLFRSSSVSVGYRIIQGNMKVTHYEPFFGDFYVKALDTTTAFTASGLFLSFKTAKGENTEWHINFGIYSGSSQDFGKMQDTSIAVEGIVNDRLIVTVSMNQLMIEVPVYGSLQSSAFGLGLGLTF